MTNIGRPVKRKVATVRGESMVVTMALDGIWLREPRRRTAYLLPYGVAFMAAVRLHVEAERRAKKAKKAKRGLL